MENLTRFNFADISFPAGAGRRIFEYYYYRGKLKVIFHLLHYNGRNYTAKTFEISLAAQPTYPVNPENKDNDYCRYLQRLEHGIRRHMAETSTDIETRRNKIIRLINHLQ